MTDKSYTNTWWVTRGLVYDTDVSLTCGSVMCTECAMTLRSVRRPASLSISTSLRPGWSHSTVARQSTLSTAWLCRKGRS